MVDNATSGVDEHDTEGVTVRVTTPARTVVDCFKFRNKIGIDAAVEAIREYRRLRKGTVDARGWDCPSRAGLPKPIRAR